METSPRWRVPGVRAVRWDHADYPIGFRQENLVPPRLVYLRGLIEALPPPSKCVAIVGARRCTPEGRSTARDLASGVGAAGLTVVSGLAIGIDTAAHEGAIDAGGRTIAVLASPVDRPGPMRNLGLADEIVSGAGWLLSERGVNEEVRPHDFPRRNRLVAALAGVVVVVEAGLPSGTLTTVGHALRLGREVGAVPGPVRSPASAGSNRLIQNGAALIASADDILRLMGEVPAVHHAVATEDPDEFALLAGLPGGSGSVDAWVVSSGVPGPKARAALARLVARGALRSIGAGRLARVL